MRLTVIGCAGSFPGPESPASCYLVEADGFRLLLDFGNGALGVLQRHAGLYDIDAICLSHLHGDHCLDMCSYWVARTYGPGGPLPSIPVYGPAGTAAQFGTNTLGFFQGEGGTVPCTIGSIMLNAGTEYPSNYMSAAGQTLNISENPALFSLIGTNYGGNGTTTFQLPDLTSAAPDNTIYLICVSGVFP